jgi:L-rhamnose mutarotase
VSDAPTSAERFAWRAKLRPGMRDEYIRRHHEIWPEMTALLDEAGIRNYSIWLSGDDVFGCFEAARGLAHARRVQQASPVYHRWAEHMKDAMILARDPATGAPPGLEEVFHHA